jgi:hypothetical protein
LPLKYGTTWIGLYSVESAIRNCFSFVMRPQCPSKWEEEGKELWQ